MHKKILISSITNIDYPQKQGFPTRNLQFLKVRGVFRVESSGTIEKKKNENA